MGKFLTTSPSGTDGRRGTRGALARRESRLGVVLTLPAMVVVAVLVAFPLLWNVALSFQDARLINIRATSLVGFDPTLDNYRLVTGTRDFWPVLRTTLVYSIAGAVLSTLMGLWAALALRRSFRGRGLVRGLMLFPYVAPVIAATFVWRVFFNPQFGLSGVLMSAAGIQPLDPLNTRAQEVDVLGLFSLSIPLALMMVIAFEAWRYFPLAFLFILARLQSIPTEVEEAAIVDGASIVQRFRYVLLPELQSTITVLLLLRFIWAFNKFDDVFLLNRGGSGTKVIAVKVIDWLTGRSNVGAAAALGMVLAAILVGSVLLYLRAAKKAGVQA